MPKKIHKNKVMNHNISIWLIVGILLILTLILFRKVLPFNVLAYATDQITAGYAFREFETRILRTLHYFPLWNPYLFSGIPFVDAFHGDIFYVTAFMRLIFPTNVVMNWQFVIHTFLAGIFMFLFLHEFKINRELKVLLSIGYMFSGYSVTLIFSGHDAKVAIFALTPLIMWTVLKGTRTKNIHYSVLCGFVMGLGLLAPHLQMMYYLYMSVSFYYLMEIVRSIIKKDLKDTLLLASQYFVIILISFLIGAIQLYPGYQYTSIFSPRSTGIRGYEFSTSWSMPWEDYLSAFFARFSNFMDSYWGRAPFKINSEYSGGIALFLLLLSIFTGSFKKNRQAAFFSFTFVLFSVMALGGFTPVYKIYYTVLPGIKKFRAPSMSFFLVVFSIYTLGALALENLDEIKKNFKTYRKFLYTGFGLILLWLLTTLFKSQTISILHNLFNVNPNKYQALLLTYHYIPLSFLRTGVILIIFTYMIFKVFDEKNAVYTLLILGIITYLDLFQIDNIFIKSLPSPEKLYAKDEVVQFLEKDKDVFRVFPLFYRTDENYLMLHNIESIGGHHGNQFQRYQEYLGNPTHFMFRPQEVPYLLKYPYLIDLLNVKYIVTQPTPKDLSPYKQNPLVFNLLNEINSLIYDTTRFIPVYIARDYRTQYVIFKNRNFLPRLFFVNKYTVIPKKDSILKYMLSNNFKPYREVVLEEDPKIRFDDLQRDTIMKNDSITTTPKGNFKFIKREPNHIMIEYTVDQKSLLVYSENYYPKWKAFIDKKPVKTYRANYIMRAIITEKGKHILEFKYDSSLYNRLGLLSFLLSIFSLSFFLVEDTKKRKNR